MTTKKVVKKIKEVKIMNRIKLIYKKCDDPYTTGNEWDYLRDTDWGGQVWSCLYTLDRDATMRANDGDISLEHINDDVVVYTDDITDEELDQLSKDGRGYDCLAWDDYDYYCYAEYIENWSGYYEIPCEVDGDDAIINVTVDDSGHIVNDKKIK